MSASGTVLLSICAARAALPLSPCAFFASGCRGHQQHAKVEVEPAPAHSCCAHDDEPAGNQSQRQREPSNGDCCRTSPFVPMGQKLVAASQPAAFLAVLPRLDDSSVGGIAPIAIVVPQPLSLHILHCQWRC